LAPQALLQVGLQRFQAGFDLGSSRRTPGPILNLAKRETFVEQIDLLSKHVALAQGDGDELVVQPPGQAGFKQLLGFLGGGVSST